jgi:hypothetical protein
MIESPTDRDMQQDADSFQIEPLFERGLSDAI